jgi:hypothetical protein
MIIKEKESNFYICCSDPMLKCHGCKCMAWTWQTYVTYPNQGKTGIAPPERVHVISSTEGYCGLTSGE